MPFRRRISSSSSEERGRPRFRESFPIMEENVCRLHFCRSEVETKRTNSTEPIPSLVTSPSLSQHHLHPLPSLQALGSSQHRKLRMSIPLAADIPTNYSLAALPWLRWPGRYYARIRVKHGNFSGSRLFDSVWPW